jgi:hypothetical protein
MNAEFKNSNEETEETSMVENATDESAPEAPAAEEDAPAAEAEAPTEAPAADDADEASTDK